MSPIYTYPMSRRPNSASPLGRILNGRGFSVERLSQTTGISTRTISDYTAGRKGYVDWHLSAIAEALDVDPEELLEGSRVG